MKLAYIQFLKVVFILKNFKNFKFFLEQKSNYNSFF